VILTAASSALGRQFIRLCAREGIETINLVRRDESIKSLKEECGARYVLNTNSDTFFQDLDALIKELNPTAFVDYLGGDLPGKIFERMPERSLMMIVGILTMQPVTLNNRDILTNMKTVTGVHVTKWFATRTPAENISYL
jgi:NADPH:quinone reductase-like Zn-dependent oxidoreductase